MDTKVVLEYVWHCFLMITIGLTNTNDIRKRQYINWLLNEKCFPICRLFVDFPSVISVRKLLFVSIFLFANVLFVLIFGAWMCTAGDSNNNK